MDPSPSHKINVRFVRENLPQKSSNKKKKRDKKVNSKSPSRVFANVKKYIQSKLSRTKEVHSKEVTTPKETKNYLKALADVARRNWFALTITPIIIAILIVGGWLIARRYSYFTDIPRYLPADAVVFVAVNIDVINSEPLAFAKLMKYVGKEDDVMKYYDDEIVPLADEFNLDLNSVRQNVKHEIGFAMIPSHGDILSRSLFLEVSSPGKAKRILESISQDMSIEITDYKEEKIFTIADTENPKDETKSYHFVYLSDFAIITSDLSSAFVYVDVQEGSLDKLSKDKSYREVSKKFGVNPLAVAYADIETAETHIRGITENNPLEQVKRFANLSDNVVGIALRAGDENIQFDAYAKSSKNNHRDSGSKGNSELMKLLPRSTIAAIEGADFSEQFELGRSHLERVNPVYSYYFANTEKQLKNNFQFNLEKDFLSHFKDNYVIAVDTSTSRYKTSGKVYRNMTFILEMSDPKAFTQDEQAFHEKITKIIGSQFGNPHAEAIREDYEGRDVRIIQGDDLPVDVFYTTIDDSVVISTSKDIFIGFADESSTLKKDEQFLQATNSSGIDKAQRVYYFNLELASKTYLEKVDFAQKGVEIIDVIYAAENHDDSLTHINGVVSFR
ncbi:DUF3352 domain-containing protein [Patescibacteria group bacterium]